MGNLTTYYPLVQWKKEEGGYKYRHDFPEAGGGHHSPQQEHHRVYRNFDGDVINKVHPISHALKGDEGEGTRYEYDAQTGTW